VSSPLQNQTIFPNPSENSFQLITDSPIAISIYSLDGILLESKIIDNNISFGSNLKNGIYLIKYEYNGAFKTEKIIKQ
jgi:hypothetical protein